MASAGNMNAEQVRSRAAGVLFFVGFGAVWIYVGLAQTHHASGRMLALAAAVTATLLAWTMLLMRRCRDLRAIASSAEDEERARRMFAAVNIIQWVSIGTAVAILGLLHMPQYVAPAVAIIVGLHLFPLAGSFRHTQHYVTGALLVAWACCCLMWEPPTRVSGAAALGAGTILLGSAGVTLMRYLGAFRTAPGAVVAAES